MLKRHVLQKILWIINQQTIHSSHPSFNLPHIRLFIRLVVRVFQNAKSEKLTFFWTVIHENWTKFKGYYLYRKNFLLASLARSEKKILFCSFFVQIWKRVGSPTTSLGSISPLWQMPENEKWMFFFCRKKHLLSSLFVLS